MSVIDDLYQLIQERKVNPPEGSYTAKLFAKGENEILKKMGEEAVEVIIAAKGEGDDRVIYELADFLYHSLVLLAVEEELARRFK
jgi:phosphoribosyl-ATP pyrophosphohydrolase